MPLAVTGAAGFIGSSLVETLLSRGHRVVAIDRRAMPARPGQERLVGDLNAADDAIAAALREADAVFHLAGAPGVRGHGDVERRRRRDNVDAARVVLDTVPRSTPLIVTSSSSVYGGTTGRPCSESDRPAPRGGYAGSKLDVERLCAKRVSAGGHVAVARPFTVAGERQRPDMAIARWLAAAASGTPLHVYGGLDRTRDVTDVRAVVEGLVRIAERGVRATVNLGTGTPVSLAEIVTVVAAVTDCTPAVVVTPAAAVEPRHTLADTSRCEQLLGFVPSTDLFDVVRRQAAAAGGHGARAPAAALEPA